MPHFPITRWRSFCYHKLVSRFHPLPWRPTPLAPKLHATHRYIRLQLKIDAHQLGLHRPRSAAHGQAQIVARLDRQQTALFPAILCPAALVILLVNHTKLGGARHLLDGTRPLSDKRTKSWQWCPRPGHVVYYNLSPVQRHHTTTLRLRVRVAWVVPRVRLLALPTLSQRVVYIRVVVHEGVRIWSDAFVLTLRVLGWLKKINVSKSGKELNFWISHLWVTRTNFRWLLSNTAIVWVLIVAL